MKTIMSIIILAAILFVSMFGVANAVEDSFTVDLDIAKTVINRTEPIYVQWMVRNDGDNALTLLIKPNPYYSYPAVTYMLRVKSIRVTGIPVDVSTAGTLGSASYSTVTAHSNACVWEMSLRSIFGAAIPATLSPGLYRVSVDGTWEGVTADGRTGYSAQAYFMVQ